VSHGYDIAHAHFIVPGGVVARWAARRYRLPYIVTSHGSDVLHYNQRFRLLYPLLARPWAAILQEALAVTAPTHFLARHIQRQKVDQAVAIIPNAVDQRHVTAHRKERRILLVTRLVALKGVQDVLDALASLPIDGWHVDIVGDGPYRSALERRVVQRGLSHCVTFHGWLDNRGEWMQQLYGRASVYVSASRLENMSIALLEALAARCAVVASDVGGAAEFIDREWLFEPGDVGALAARLRIAMDQYRVPRANPHESEQRWSGVIRQYEALWAQ
jgi:glycosyltransferase involved in cell wall biosynthesis